METVADERQYDEFVKKLMIILQHHFETVELVSDQATSKKLIIVTHMGHQAVIDTESREIQIREENGEYRKALQEIINNLMEVHAPVNLHRCC